VSALRFERQQQAPSGRWTRQTKEQQMNQMLIRDLQFAAASEIAVDLEMADGTGQFVGVEHVDIEQGLVHVWQPDRGPGATRSIVLDGIVDSSISGIYWKRPDVAA
jgi:hypothetical protein